MRLLPVSSRDKDAAARARSDRARRPQNQDPGRHRPPDSVLGDAGGQEPCDGPGRCRLPARFLIIDRDGKFPRLSGAILADVGIDVVLSGVRMPRMNSIMERWVQTCRHELLDRTLIWNQSHLLHSLRESEESCNGQ